LGYADAVGTVFEDGRHPHRGWTERPTSRRSVLKALGRSHTIGDQTIPEALGLRGFRGKKSVADFLPL
jgi:hypothetical protein